MINIIWDQGFKQAYKKKTKNSEKLKNKFWESIELFSVDPFNPKLRTHKLTGKLDKLWAFSVSYDCRVIFMFTDNKNEVVLIDIGSHDEVY
ncbi:MAG: type II toxin-antitoxin system mRNA interferase toxin, RelE/StbE family [Bacteroidetes bacterium]|nr:type II toxin-antitoxin system mRNA interferase toxin, RelE/StbE family [Bacteroidota bacterium]